MRRVALLSRPGRLRPRGLFAVLGLVGLAACPEASTEETDGPPVNCLPIEAAFESNALPFIKSHCAQCHGETPTFGAPFSLMKYGPLVEGAEGERIVDKMVSSLVAGDMPPGNSPPLAHDGLDTLVGWASCGLEHPNWSEGLQANRDVFTSEQDPPAGAIAIDLTAVDEVISPTTLDDYREFRFTGLVAEDMLIRRLEGVVDDARVVHHITIQNGQDYYYAWAPGTGPMQFPEGGIRLRPRAVLSVQIHYNNGAGVPDAVDSSGVRIWVDKLGGTEWAVLSPNTFNIHVPAESTSSANTFCRATEDFHLLTAMPHMHEVGSGFDHVVQRSDGARESIIALTGWSFEAQYIYDIGMDIQKGDQLELTCTYDNPHSYPVNGGLGTSDEMCFDFLYVHPATARCR